MILAVVPNWSYLGSRTNILPNIGASLCIAAMLSFVSHCLAGPRRRDIAFGLLAMPLLLLGYGAQRHSQACTAEAWIRQQSLWRQLIQIAPDLQPGTTVGILLSHGEPCYGGAYVFESGPHGVSGALSLLYGRRDLDGWFAWVNPADLSGVSPGDVARNPKRELVVLYDQEGGRLYRVPSDALSFLSSCDACVLETPPTQPTWRWLVGYGAGE